MPQTLMQKLRLRPGEKLTVLNRPDRMYFADFEIQEEVKGHQNDVIILFVKTLEEMKRETQRLIDRQALKMNGRLLIAYPKKGNKRYDTFIHRDLILPGLGADEDGYIGNSDYKFNQMVKLDETFTMIGIKRVERGTVKKTASQSVGDYVQYLPVIKQELEGEKEALDFFLSLTEGYQRNWARYIYSAKREETQEKRKQEMISLLKQGIKFK